jgi:hypothetical protein
MGLWKTSSNARLLIKQPFRKCLPRHAVAYARKASGGTGRRVIGFTTGLVGRVLCKCAEKCLREGDATAAEKAVASKAAVTQTVSFFM